MSVEDKLMEQLEEDRKRTQELYDDIKKNVLTQQDYVMLGDVVVKISDLLSKQTNQLIEVYKAQQKTKKPEDDDFKLSKDEFEEIQEYIEDNVKAFSK